MNDDQWEYNDNDNESINFPVNQISSYSSNQGGS